MDFPFRQHPEATKDGIHRRSDPPEFMAWLGPSAAGDVVHVSETRVDPPFIPRVQMVPIVHAHIGRKHCGPHRDVDSEETGEDPGPRVDPLDATEILGGKRVCRNRAVPSA